MINTSYGQIGDSGTLTIHGIPAVEIDRWAQLTGEKMRVLSAEGREFKTLTFTIGPVEIKLYS